MVPVPYAFSGAKCFSQTSVGTHVTLVEVIHRDQTNEVLELYRIIDLSLG